MLHTGTECITFATLRNEVPHLHTHILTAQTFIPKTRSVCAFHSSHTYFNNIHCTSDSYYFTSSHGVRKRCQREPLSSPLALFFTGLSAFFAIFYAILLIFSFFSRLLQFFAARSAGEAVYSLLRALKCTIIPGWGGAERHQTTFSLQKSTCTRAHKSKMYLLATVGSMRRCFSLAFYLNLCYYNGSGGRAT